MQDLKPWYLSRTIWASLVTIGCAAAGVSGFGIDPADGSALTETILGAVTAISGLVAIVGRIGARNRIG